MYEALVDFKKVFTELSPILQKPSPTHSGVAGLSLTWS